MFRTLQPFHRLLATTFLVVFVNMWLGQCVCAANISSRFGTANATTSKPMAPGCPQHRTAAPSISKGIPAHDQQLSADQDCCQGKSVAKQTLLAAAAEQQLQSPAPALLPEARRFFFRPAAGQWDPTAAVVLVSRQVLPPKIPDIRIFIGSLTI
ncbi:hypothetical protein [Hymenobacter psychrotolerans]|uniref:Uncharacterized protein n=1 Tax=Hymenobacter psychrotolerans DSM 18569 TaxID=1121959 RepID=A0A1M7H048_9BACT|nr:hypothetical protein [Hymenobacter psychrotolerans]SHM22032.1 hypothetical protein SAMN02746009_04138 [Hymenobacter psychrotolerans DSM 18569]